MNCDDGEAGGPTEFLLSGSGDCPAREHLCIEITLFTRHIPLGEAVYMSSIRR